MLEKSNYQGDDFGIGLFRPLMSTPTQLSRPWLFLRTSIEEAALEGLLVRSGAARVFNNMLGRRGFALAMQMRRCYGDRGDEDQVCIQLVNWGRACWLGVV